MGPRYRSRPGYAATRSHAAPQHLPAFLLPFMASAFPLINHILYKMSAELNSETNKRVFVKIHQVKRGTLQECLLPTTRLKKQDDASALRPSVDPPLPIAARLPSRRADSLFFVHLSFSRRSLLFPHRHVALHVTRFSFVCFFDPHVME